MGVGLVCWAFEGDLDLWLLVYDRDRISDAADFETTGKSGSESLSSGTKLAFEKGEAGLDRPEEWVAESTRDDVE